MAIILGRKPGGGGGGAPSGPAGGDLSGTYPNPTISDQGSADGFTLTSDGAGGTAFERPPGFQLDYVEITAPVTITGTNPAGANTCITGSSVAFDGSTRVCIEVYSPDITVGSTASSSIQVILFEDATEIGAIAFFLTANVHASMLVRRFRTPSAASHTYTVKAYRAVSNGIFQAGAGTGDLYSPAYLRITVA